METLPKFIVIWMDYWDGKVKRSRSNVKSKNSVKLLYDGPDGDSKLLYLFRVKTLKYGSVSVPQV